MSYAALAAGAGTAIGGAVGGKKASKGSNKAANLQADISNRLFSETDPLRQSLIGRSADFLGVGGAQIGTGPDQAVRMGRNYFAAPGQPITLPTSTTGFGDVRSTPTFAAYKDVADRSFGRARDNVLSTLPSGGGLSSALVNLEGQRADNLTQGAGNIYDAELARAMTLATGQTGVAIGGLGQAANAQALNAQAAATQNAGKSSALGTGLGAYMGQKKPATTTGTGSSTGKG